jgi:AraC-like DNA-binding protein
MSTRPPSPILFRAHQDVGLEHIAASFFGHRFPAHAHDSYLIGLTLEGVEEVLQSGRERHVRPGQVRFINPWEVHSGGAAPRGTWRYEALYVPEPVMAEALGGDGEAGLPRFAEAVVDDPGLAASLRGLFAILRSSAEPLERQSRFAALAAGPLARHLGRGTAPVRPDHPAIRRARAFLAEHALTRLSLDRIALEAGLSKFHLLRTFKAATGFTPWQYQVQLRIEAAKRLLRAGEPPSQIADACGFVDQSHFTRVFKSLLGVTPAIYAASHRPAHVAQHSTRRSARPGAASRQQRGG